MASKTRPLPTHIGEVRVSGSYFEYINGFLEMFPQRILDEAAKKAFARKSGPVAGVVTAADLSESARELMPAALDELDDLLEVCEKHHGRKKAS